MSARAKVAECGTNAGYKRHMRQGTVPCRPCCDAHAAAARRWTAAVRCARPVTATPPRPVAPCGTRAAYVRHLRHGEVPCDPCRTANAEAVRAWKTRGVAA